MSSADINPEWQLVAIGRGSFATVSILLGRPVAFKHVIVSEHAPQLKAEFKAICSVYNFCNTDSFFAISRPLAHYDPGISASFVSQAGSPPSTATGRSRVPRPMVSEADFKALKLESAAYAMDHVLPIPLSTAQRIRDLFYPPGQEAAKVPSLCRLYFGKVIETTPIAGRPSRFFNSTNFPLDIPRYTQLQEAYGGDLPSVGEIAQGMGEMLGRFHWRSGYDGRDVEFVIGGEGFSGIAMNVIDFNQVRPNSNHFSNSNSITLPQDAPMVEDEG